MTYGANAGTGQIQISSDDVIYNDSYDIAIKITRSGGLGEGGFSYSLNGGRTFSNPVTIPASGIVKLSNNLITIRFWAGDGRFLVGDEYKCSIKGDQSKRDYSPYILAMIAIVATALLAVCYRLSMMRAMPQSYRLFEYKQVESRKKRGLPKRREL